MPVEQTNYRIDVDAKRQAYKILQQMGVKPRDAVNMLMHHIALYGELPFKPSVPNEITLKTFEETDAGKQLNHYNSINDFFAKMGNG